MKTARIPPFGKSLVVAAIVAAGASPGLMAGAPARKTHLFILSGQSNMARLDPALSFTPMVTQAFSNDQVIVIKDAQGGEPIRRWYKQWKPAKRKAPPAPGDLYDRLMEKVRAAIATNRPDTVTFVWMQGGRDAKERQGDVYADSLRGLFSQLEADLGRNDLNYVIGRLYGANPVSETNPHWNIVRQAQVDVANALPRGAWVDSDDLEIGPDGQHFNEKGYTAFGARFAEKAIELVRKAAGAEASPAPAEQGTVQP
jgi:hypothetical protein